MRSAPLGQGRERGARTACWTANPLLSCEADRRHAASVGLSSQAISAYPSIRAFRAATRTGRHARRSRVAAAVRRHYSRPEPRVATVPWPSARQDRRRDRVAEACARCRSPLPMVVNAVTPARPHTKVTGSASRPSLANGERAQRTIGRRGFAIAALGLTVLVAGGSLGQSRPAPERVTAAVPIPRSAELAAERLLAAQRSPSGLGLGSTPATDPGPEGYDTDMMLRVLPQLERAVHFADPSRTGREVRALGFHVDWTLIVRRARHAPFLRTAPPTGEGETTIATDVPHPPSGTRVLSVLPASDESAPTSRTRDLQIEVTPTDARGLAE